MGLRGHAKRELCLRTGSKQPPPGLMSSAVDGELAARPCPEGGDQWHQVYLEARSQRRGTTLRPQLRLALNQLWVLSCGKEAPGQEEEEEEGSEEDSTSLIFSWPTGSCLATFGSRALKELWLGTLLGTPEGDKRARVTRLPSLKVLQKELSRRHAWRTLSARSLDRLMEGQAEELLAVLQQQGPATDGIFRRAASGTALRELREALDHGADVELGSQPPLLLAVLLKDFLRSIPSKLLVNNLYEDWMAAMRKSSKEEKVEELKAVAEKMPGANLLLLKRLLALLQHIGHNAATSRMTCSNLAICVGPNLLSPPNEELLPLEAMLAVTEKVKVLVEFLMENWRELFAEEASDESCPAAEELPAPTETSRDPRLEEQSVPAGTAGTQHRTEASPHAPPSLLGVLKEAGGDRLLESETGEVVSGHLPTPTFLL
ncbi:uncharacterized protein LOC142081261 [Calonectris borealis]|uniref:uncharacterized protein LOC142081261 n=1 Tax=Calonectris borealis TaxID=1323832 RepID=UPI003F4C6254